MDLFTLYAIFALINLGGWFKGIAVIIGISFLLTAPALIIAGCDNKGDGFYYFNKLKTWIIFSAVLVVLSSLASVLIPDEEQMWYIVGGYAVTNVEGIQELPENIVGAANAFLEKYQPEATESAE